MIFRFLTSILTLYDFLLHTSETFCFNTKFLNRLIDYLSHNYLIRFGKQLVNDKRILEINIICDLNPK